MRGSPTAELFFDNVEIPDGAPISRIVQQGLMTRKCIGQSRRRSCGVDVGIRPREAGPQRWAIGVCTPPSSICLGRMGSHEYG